MIWYVMSIIALLTLVGALSWLLVRVIKVNLVLVDQRDELVDVIEESLDELDDVYTRIAHAAETPVLSDEPLVRNLLADIKHAKNVVLGIAGKVVVYGDDSDVEDGNR